MARTARPTRPAAWSTPGRSHAGSPRVCAPPTIWTSNNAYPFLAATNDLLLSGPTQTNVNDLILVFVF